MIIVGAKGFAKEVLQIIAVDQKLDDAQIVFFDNVSQNLPEKLFGKFTILRSFEAVKNYLSNTKDKAFVLGLGSPKYRKKLYADFIDLGAKPVSAISNNAEVGSFDVSIGTGTAVMSGAIISNSVSIGKGCIVYYNSVVTHDCSLGDFVEVSPGAKICGRCTIGDGTSIGANTTVLPDVNIGANAVIGAGAVIVKDVPDNVTVVGVPGKII